MGVEKTAVLGISSPDDEFNYFSTLLDAINPETGEAFFYVIKVGLVCAACLTSGAICTHMLRRLPAWKGPGRHKLVQEIMKDQRDLFNREAGGINLGGKSFCYDKTWIHALVNRPVYVFRENVQILYMGIDPSGGGASSDYSIVTTTVQDGQNVICGVDSSGSRDQDVIIALIRGHIERLREFDEYKDAYIEVFIENNMSHISSSSVAAWLLPYQRVRMAIEGSKGELGVHTGEPEKQNYAEGLQVLMVDNRIHFAHNVASIDWKYNRMGLIDQLRVFRRESKETGEPGVSKPKVWFTGKSHGRKDDLVLALQIALYWMNRKRVNAQFMAYYAKLGVRTGGLVMTREGG